MSQTISQLCALYPKAAAATENLRFNKKLRRLVIEKLSKLEGSTSPRDLATKIVNELSTDTNLNFLFGEEVVKSMDKSHLVYSKLDHAIALSINAYTGLISKSSFETELFWRKSKKSANIKNLCGNFDVHLLGKAEHYRVYVTDPSVEVCVAKNVQPFRFLEEDVRDRQKMVTPRDVTFVKLSEDRALMLFNSPNDGIQRRFEIGMDKVSGYKFKAITEYIQDGTILVDRDFSGDEYLTNNFGEFVGEKRYGVTPTVWMIDTTNQGRMGDQGPRGKRGEKGVDRNKFGINAGLLQLDVMEQRKRLVTNKEEYDRAFIERSGWVLPMSKALIKDWSK
ncbi:hypothetical protein [Polynucleobacter sp. JS-JIR-5-A7]|uniref:hypothetical protein n=1 Tax=Polynucleobacter sp. JS-JIR-5-A7 TaxID=1758395 RepID=UPI001BFE9F22|nr:hypothetical protein [Polynucleobacter sp. JS-JIR-5-A7]QWE06046.1 hypothetical protein AOC29_07965 [Polynucleobacter sp. JS-JIR-5-A7]